MFGSIQGGEVEEFVEISQITLSYVRSTQISLSKVGIDTITVSLKKKENLGSGKS